MPMQKKPGPGKPRLVGNLVRYDAWAHELLYAIRSLMVAEGVQLRDPTVRIHTTRAEAELAALRDAWAHINNVWLAVGGRRDMLVLLTATERENAT